MVVKAEVLIKDMWESVERFRNKVALNRNEVHRDIDALAAALDKMVDKLATVANLVNIS